MTSEQERFHITVSSADRTVMRGWWADEAVARDKTMGARTDATAGHGPRRK